ncbi:hypothetical protein [Streptomyces sp. NPDC030392]|uniref:hypothetical protein n=1 Tax=unclassified Streptomyces TaxID=2593676 RepID=UPI003403A661
MVVDAAERRFVLGELPVLLLGGAPLCGVLPELRVADGRVSVCEGWAVVARITLCVVDGPGDAGCVMPGALTAEEFPHLAEWCDAVERAGGAVVMSLDALPPADQALDWDALLFGGSRGGFMPALTAS